MDDTPDNERKGPLPWLKLWHEILDSPKIQLMSGELFKGWVNVLCLTCRHNNEGALPDLGSITFALRVSTKEAESLLLQLLNRGLLERHEGGFRVHDWAHWQANRVTPEALRVSRYRARLRAQGE